jgi:hypothetical protein
MTMKSPLCQIIAMSIALALAGVAPAGQSVHIRLKDGSTWRGEVSEQVEVSILEQGVEVKMIGELVKAADLYIIVEGNVAGTIAKKTIFKGDIVSMRSLDEQSEEVQQSRSGVRQRSSDDDTAQDDAASAGPGVFVLPLEGPVGTDIRQDEIEAIGEEADKYGPGQIIVLRIKTNGGLVSEEIECEEAIAELQKRHRVVCWIEKAISAGAAIAMACEEVYFMTEGICGSVTTLADNQSVPEDQGGAKFVEALVRTAKRNGYSEYIARAMKYNHYMCSYDKDPVTGEVTFYGDLSGEFILSDGDSNLNFNASKALHCGFSKGTADTTEELAKLLDLPKWREVSDYGRKIAEDWQDTVKRAEEEIPRLIARTNYWKTSGGERERIGALIQIFTELIRWWDRAPEVCRGRIPEKRVLERQVEELRRQLARMRR